jgi:SOS-response transcriptional repressor LexA
MKELPPRQKQICDFIVKYHAEHGYSPSVADISGFLGTCSSTTYTYLEILKKKGFVTSVYGVPRSFVCVKAS